MKLKELAEFAGQEPAHIEYCLGMLKELSLSEFVGALCQAAYDTGYVDCQMAEESNFGDDDFPFLDDNP